MQHHAIIHQLLDGKSNVPHASVCRQVQHFKHASMILNMGIEFGNNVVTEAQAFSAEAESPPAHKAYDLRSRSANSVPPGFGEDATPEAAAAAERAASVTLGPIKKRLKVCHWC